MDLFTVYLSCSIHLSTYCTILSETLTCSEVFLITNRSFEFAMQVTVLLQMMKYFESSIANIKKKRVKQYIHACIFVYLGYFVIFIICLISSVCIVKVIRLLVVGTTIYGIYRNSLCYCEFDHILFLYLDL